MIVTETIRVRAEGDRIRRGIYRDFPTAYRDQAGRRVNVVFEPLAVTRDGVAEPWHAEPFANGVNAMCFERQLAGDFNRIAESLASRAEDADGILEVDESMLRDADDRAVKVLLDDIATLTALGREPQLNVITRYPRDERGLAISVDVHSFHVDRAPIEADTFLCTYAGASSEGLDNDDAERLLDDPKIAGAIHDDVSEGSYDLHFRAKPGAAPYAFGVGNLWRVAVDWPGSAVLPCIHRAPPHDGRPRLLLIA
jgi:hypothetical protein